MGIIKNGDKERVRNKVALVSVIRKGDSEADAMKSLDELERLVDTAGGETFGRMIQIKDSPDPRSVLGSGKIIELAAACSLNEIDLVVFDSDLSPAQIRNIEDAMTSDVMVIDRSMLILDIFALHAVSGEGKLQVELAQLKYSAPRLMGMGKDMSRLGGGIGTRGPGESKLEMDRRYTRKRIAALENDIKELDKNRMTMRASRDRSGHCKVVIVGYTNAGKSTLLNSLTGAGILAEDKLFATLDPTTRKFTLPCGESILLTDTVGFIKKLPHHLVSAFKSTLDEAVYSDLLLILIDSSDPEYRSELEVTENLLEELGAADKPRLYVFNKCDNGFSELPTVPGAPKENVLYISAKTGQGTELLVSRIEEVVTSGKREVVFEIPNAEAGALNTLYGNATVTNVEYGDEYIKVSAITDEKIRGMLSKYLPDEYKDKATEEDE